MSLDQFDRDDSEGGGESSIDLRHYWNIIKKRRWVIIATTLVIATLAVVFTMRKPKIYQATATVIVDPFAPNFFGNQGSEVVQLGSGNLWMPAEYYNTQIRILNSTSLARQTVVEHGLQKHPALVGGHGAALTEEQRIDRAAIVLRSLVSVNVARDSRVFEISVMHTDPQVAALFANLVTREYISQNVGFKQTVTSEGRGAVAQQLQKARDEFESTGNDLLTFKDKHKLIESPIEDKQSQTLLSLQVFRQERDRAAMQLDSLSSRRSAVARLIKQGSTDIPVELTNDASSITPLAALVEDEQRKYDELAANYGDKWPAVTQQKARLDTARGALTRKLTSLLAGLDESVTATREILGKSSARVVELGEEQRLLDKLAQEYKQLSLAARIAEERYVQLTGRHDQSTMQEADQANNIRQLDEARVPSRPVSPNMRLSLLMGASLGLLLALGLAFLIEFLDRSVKSQEDVEKTIGLPFLGMVPSLEHQSDGKGTPELFIARQPSSTIAECCRVVRTNILFSSPDKPIRSLLVTSSNPVEGKTTSVVNLGIVMAQSGHRTLIVDTDMRRPRLHKALGTGNENGLSRLILGETDLDAAVKSTEVPNLFLLPCGPIPPNPAELLQTEKFAALAELLKSKYDRVIFDSPPVLAVTDAAVLSRVVDGCVLVVRAGRTPRESVLRSKHAVQAVNRRIIGVILNDVNLKNPHYASYYHYYQYKPHEPVGEGKGG